MTQEDTPTPLQGTAPTAPQAIASGSADTASQSAPAHQPTGKADQGGFYWGTGRRKTAVARVRLRPGEGKFLVNGHEIDRYFKEERDRKNVQAPLEITQTQGKLDVHVNVKGGGFTGQAGAVLLGLSRALKIYDGGLEPILRDKEFLTRDPREVERKKYGQRGARRRFQFSKR